MKKVLLLLANGFETYEASAFIDVIGWNLIDGDGSTRLFTCGMQKEIKTTFNQKVVVDYLIEEIDVGSFDALAVPGGFEEYNYYEDAYSEQFVSLIRKFNEQNKTIASVCVGSLPIGKSGILKNREATTYKVGKVRQQTLKSYGANVINEPVVTDLNVITSWNPSTAIDVAFLLLELLTSKNNTQHIREIMGFKPKNN
ncbi:Putative cysteine protease YraA [Salinivirga cyanobacteriivorans]|uniref:Cysteine protease YraA n=1 Tax=Salinivirga cyanobacteriivorans TaxID=1307839 RepID=A0A0S2I4C9_9BACT|nr:DJ-1/PfpI family protein [Salinivirga cyanobacteriivorans]ALO17199.1 Putative cysteine protease YraA [Salinivirga cyanobacteriivorans]